MRVGLLRFGLSLSGILCRCASEQQDQTFDYVIVGGGPAGLVLANRLSENSSLLVAIIEAGGYADNVIGNISEVPGLDFNFLITPPPAEIADIEWGFNTTPQYVSGLRTRAPR